MDDYDDLDDEDNDEDELEEEVGEQQQEEELPPPQRPLHPDRYGLLKTGPQTLDVFRKKGYSVEKFLGKGAYGFVFRGYYSKPGEPEHYVAIKMINLDKVKDVFRKKLWPREVTALKDLHHPYLLAVYDIIRCDNRMYVFMEFANGGDLIHYIKRKGPVSEAVGRYWFRQCLSAMRYMHVDMQMAHRDIKVDNVLLHKLPGKDEVFKAKVADFGFARSGAEGKMSETFCGTRAYQCPQILRSKCYDIYAADCWALGVTLFVMLNKKYPFHFSKDNKIQYREQTDPNRKRRFIKKFSDEVEDLIEQFFVVLEADRITVAEALEHKWFSMQQK